MPEGFCPYAWIDLYPSICALMDGRELTNAWYKNPKVKLLCCTDGVRPVLFKLEQVGEM